VRKFKIFFLAVIAIGVGTMTMTSCSKNNSGPAKFTDSVFYSAWQPLNMTFEGVDPNTGDSAWEQVITNSKVTAAIISSGVVLTYVVEGITNAGDTVIQSADNLLVPYLSVNSIDLGWEGNNPNGALFRYVIIPGNVLTTNNVTPKQLKSMNYTEVTKLLGSTTAKQSAAGALSTQ
jgi:hypothetical protein